MSFPRFIINSVAIAQNELRLFMRNRTAILISLVLVPGFFAATIGTSGGQGGTTLHPTADTPIAFMDEDNSIASLRLLQTLRISPDFHNLIEVSNENGAIAQLGTKRYYAVIVIPHGFRDDLENGIKARVLLYGDDSEPGVLDQIYINLTDYVRNFNPQIEVQAVLTSQELRRNLTEGVEIINIGASYASVNRQLTHMLALVQIFAVFYEIAGGLSREMEDGTFTRLIISPMNVGSVFVGKTLFDLVLSAARTFIVVGIAELALDASPKTDLGTILALSLSVSLVTMGIAFVVGSLKVRPRAVVIIEFFLILFTFAFSGLMIDTQLFVGLTGFVADHFPFTYVFDALNRTILSGTPLLSLTTDMEFTIGYIVALYLLSYVLIRYLTERLIT